MSSLNVLLGVVLACGVSSCSADNCGGALPRKFQLVSQTLVGSGTNHAQENGSNQTTVQYQNTSISIDVQKYNVRQFIVQRGPEKEPDGSLTESEIGFIMNMNAGTTANMNKNCASCNRTCTIAKIPGIVKLWLPTIIKKVETQLVNGFTCLDHHDSLYKFEVKIPSKQVPFSRFFPAGTNRTIDAEVTDAFLLQSLHSVDVDEDGRTESNMEYSTSQAGGPTADDLSPPTSWNCKDDPGTIAALDGQLISPFVGHHGLDLGKLTALLAESEVELLV